MGEFQITQRVRKVLRKWKTTMIGIFIASMLIQLPNALATKYHAGYYYYSPPGGSPPDDGVSVVIEAISPSITGDEVFYQWPCAMLSYSYNYWVQVGYGKSSATSYSLKWYREKWDEAGHSGIQWIAAGPTSGNTNHYYLERSGSTWYCGVTNIFERSYSLSPYTPVDLQAMSETNDTSISIDGSDFDEISYKNGNDWNFWDRHEALTTHYSITEDGHDHWYMSEE
jgi:hypothetical protein